MGPADPMGASMKQAGLVGAPRLLFLLLPLPLHSCL